MVVQEWLWLTPAAKHAAYKSPVEDMLGRMGYPFLRGIKGGFGSRDHLDEDRFNGRAWVSGDVLDRGLIGSNELPPPFVADFSDMPHQLGPNSQGVVCHQRTPKGLGQILRNMWLKAASYGMYELLDILLGRCCYRGAFPAEEVETCAVTLLNARQLNGVTALMAANERNDADTARVLQQLACALPTGARRAAVLGAGTAVGTSHVVHGGKWLEMETALCEDKFPGAIPPSGNGDIVPLKAFLQGLISFLGKHGIGIGSTMDPEELVRQIFAVLEE